MSLDLDTTAKEATPVQGEPLDAESSRLTLSLQDFVGEFGDELLDSLNHATPRFIPVSHRRTGNSLSPASSASCLRPRPKSSMPLPSC
ncbi:hypothetical protein CFBP6600_22830 [Xanthomonas arboricola pv. corylina]|nr:hypothetical protein CFBP6600_22830 [Xanthomonas arboricola pv. corylina]CAE6776930.1 hypothetical protein CFBP6600_22830 [Xanthomonas arboricola pv. corylina]